MNYNLLKQAVMQKLAGKGDAMKKALQGAYKAKFTVRGPKPKNYSRSAAGPKAKPGSAPIPEKGGLNTYMEGGAPLPPQPAAPKFSAPPTPPPNRAIQPLEHFDAFPAAPVPPPASAAPQPWQKTPNINVRLPYSAKLATGDPLYFDKAMNTQTMMGDFYQGSSTMNPKLLKGPTWGSTAGREAYGAQTLGENARPAAERIARLNSAGLGPLQAPSLAEHLQPGFDRGDMGFFMG